MMGQPERRDEFNRLISQLDAEQQKTFCVVLYLMVNDPDVRKMNAEQLLELHDKLAGNPAA